MRAAFTPVALALLLAVAPASAQEAAPPQTAPEAPVITPAPAPSSPTTTAPPAPAVEPAAPAPVQPPAGATLPEPSSQTPSAPTTEPLPQAAEPAATPPADAVSPAGTAPRDERLPHDLTPLGMFMAADWVVKAVMIGLAFASLVTWTILLSKAMEIAFAKRRARAGVRRIERAETLSGALSAGRGRWRGPVAALAAAAQEERQISGALLADGVKERASIALSRIEARAGRSIGRGTGLLATIGSTAPFVGLFGTVWGIMNSFISISESNTTNLAVVAPGIAEALLATGIGLVAAIPAVIIYNVFSRSIAGYRAILADGSAAVMRHLSRDLDRAEALPRAMPAE